MAPRDIPEPPAPVEVEYGGHWYRAVLRHWSRRTDGDPWAHVALDGRSGTFLDTVPPSRVRPGVR